MRKILLIACFLLNGAAFGQQITAVKVEKLVADYNSMDGVVVVNFWSTWCQPCIEEIPHFLAVADSLKNKNVKLLLVSLDSKEVFSTGKLKTFLAKKKWNTTHYWLNETDADHYCPAVDKSWSGVIPVTLIINKAKNYHRFYEEALGKKALLQAIEKAL